MYARAVHPADRGGPAPSETENPKLWADVPPHPKPAPASGSGSAADAARYL